MTSAVRAPQSKPPTVACLDFESVHQSDQMSRATAVYCWALRIVSLERKRVLPYPRRYGTITLKPADASNGATST